MPQFWNIVRRGTPCPNQYYTTLMKEGHSVDFRMSKLTVSDVTLKDNRNTYQCTFPELPMEEFFCSGLATLNVLPGKILNRMKHC